MEQDPLPPGKASRSVWRVLLAAQVQGTWNGAPYPALTAATHLGFQFRDLQVQFIQVLVHKGDESLKEKHRPATEMEALGSGRPWRLPP